jgi:hypothetical protein
MSSQDGPPNTQHQQTSRVLFSAPRHCFQDCRSHNISFLPKQLFLLKEQSAFLINNERNAFSLLSKAFLALPFSGFLLTAAISTFYFDLTLRFTRTHTNGERKGRDRCNMGCMTGIQARAVPIAFTAVSRMSPKPQTG